LARAADKMIEARDDWVTREPTPRGREIGRGGAIASAEQSHTVGTEPRGSLSCAVDERIEFVPKRRSVRDELV
jgi:hypothetical protein